MAPERTLARVFLGPYELGERLGTGGMAEVYVGSRVGPHGFRKKFAIKRILPDLARDPRFVAMFCDEARTLAALSHPNIVQIVDFGEDRGELFMALEYVDGVSCAKLLRSVASRSGRVPIGAALYLAHELLRALAVAHEAVDELARPLGIVHRDVSPGNVLIGRAGEVKLTDFGIVRSAVVDRRTNPGELKGKLGYMSPEQVLCGEVDARSDLFSLAIVLAELLLLRPLFAGKSEFRYLSRIQRADLSVLEQRAHEFPRGLVALLKRALSREPAERFATARAFLEALQAFAHDTNLNLGDAQLVPWLASLGLFPSQSGLREATGRARATPVEVPTLPRPDADAGPKADSGGPARLITWRVSLSRFELPARLYALAAARESGVLVGRRGAAAKQFDLVRGEIRATASSDPSELLGARLVESGVVTQKALERALQLRASRRCRTLGEALVQLGAISRASLLHALDDQRDQRFADVLAWPDVELAFLRAERRELPQQVVPPPALVTRAVRAAYTLDDLALALDPFRTRELICLGSAALPLSDLGLFAAETAVLERAPQARSLTALVGDCERCGVASTETTLRAVFIAVSAGVLVAR